MWSRQTTNLSKKLNCLLLRNYKPFCLESLLQKFRKKVIFLEEPFLNPPESHFPPPLLPPSVNLPPPVPLHYAVLVSLRLILWGLQHIQYSSTVCCCGLVSIWLVFHVQNGFQISDVKLNQCYNYSNKSQQEPRNKVNRVKRGKTCASKSRLGRVFLLIGRESDASFLNQSKSDVKQNQSKHNIAFDTHLKTALQPTLNLFQLSGVLQFLHLEVDFSSFLFPLIVFGLYLMKWTKLSCATKSES